ncbi:2TM domain-containing protein [uncultured Cellulomonas sp.]|uniref:2TM domain-containing protein n=1 Tax=uncultured Cellulomonas sp. TaxID=189682 RepID=UPI00263055F7|nr:2TM domain-containing protein [uncultured Cellulomonas sp.]
MSHPMLPDADELRARAVRRLQARRDLAAHVVAYVLVNVTLVVIWWMVGAGFFWPVFPILGWGIGLVFHAWDVLSPGPSEARIEAEMESLRRR